MLAFLTLNIYYVFNETGNIPTIGDNTMYYQKNQQKAQQLKELFEAGLISESEYKTDLKTIENQDWLDHHAE